MMLKITKKNVERLLKKLQAKNDLIAPMKTDVSRFEIIDDIKDIWLDSISYFSAKRFLFGKHQKMFSFQGNKIEEYHEKPKPRVFFGLRRCDLNAIRHLDIGMCGDTYYHCLRADNLLIGLHCWEACSEHCFCGSVGLKDFYDVMLYDRGNYYLAETGTRQGEEFAAKHKILFSATKEQLTKEEKVIEGADRLQKKDISTLYDHPDWKLGADRCLSCASCVMLCPTCHCYEITDEVSIHDISKGERYRKWSACQLKSFSRVAGDFVFREKREDRFKHRIYHQLQYFKERHGLNLCVGCGRCITGCPTRIDFVKIINGMR